MSIIIELLPISRVRKVYIKKVISLHTAPEPYSSSNTTDNTLDHPVDDSISRRSDKLRWSLTKSTGQKINEHERDSSNRRTRQFHVFVPPFIATHEHILSLAHSNEIEQPMLQYQIYFRCLPSRRFNDSTTILSFHGQFRVHVHQQAQQR